MTELSRTPHFSDPPSSSPSLVEKIFLGSGYNGLTDEEREAFNAATVEGVRTAMDKLTATVDVDALLERLLDVEEGWIDTAPIEEIVDKSQVGYVRIAPGQFDDLPKDVQASLLLLQRAQAAGHFMNGSTFNDKDVYKGLSERAMDEESELITHVLDEATGGLFQDPEFIACYDAMVADNDSRDKGFLYRTGGHLLLSDIAYVINRAHRLGNSTWERFTPEAMMKFGHDYLAAAWEMYKSAQDEQPTNTPD